MLVCVCWAAPLGLPASAPLTRPLPAPPNHNPLALQRLRTSCCTIVTLDGRRIAANGVVSGASYQVAPLEAADHRFGSSGLLGEVGAGAGWCVGAWVGWWVGEAAVLAGRASAGCGAGMVSRALSARRA